MNNECVSEALGDYTLVRLRGEVDLSWSQQVRRTILDALFPLQAKLHLYRVFLESAASEQIARRVAMKNASDNADEVGRTLRMQYNRVRQAGITKEILEIVGGAEALA